MRTRITKMEKISGLFVLIAVAGALSSTVITAVHKGWFASKLNFSAVVDSADGLHSGTPIMIAGIRAGEVDEVVLLESNHVEVRFSVFKQFHPQVKTDSEVKIIRPFVFGDKVMEISMGSLEAERVEDNHQFKSVTSLDLMDLVSGKKLGPFFSNMEGMMQNLSTLAQAFADPKRTQAFIKVFDRVEPLVAGMSEMSHQVTKLAKEMNAVLPEIRKESPEIAKQTAHLIGKMEKLVSALEPAVTSVGPELPRVTHRAVEALDELVITMKAMQKSFLLSGKVEDVRKEEKARKPTSGEPTSD